MLFSVLVIAVPSSASATVIVFSKLMKCIEVQLLSQRPLEATQVLIRGIAKNIRRMLGSITMCSITGRI